MSAATMGEGVKLLASSAKAVVVAILVSSQSWSCIVKPLATLGVRGFLQFWQTTWTFRTVDETPLYSAVYTSSNAPLFIDPTGLPVGFALANTT